MKAGWALGLAALGLAACGGAEVPDRQALIDGCVQGGEAQATCACIADAYQENLPQELFSKVADRVGREGVRMEAFIGELDDVEQMLAFSAAVEDMMACPLSGQGA